MVMIFNCLLEMTMKSSELQSEGIEVKVIRKRKRAVKTAKLSPLQLWKKEQGRRFIKLPFMR